MDVLGTFVPDLPVATICSHLHSAEELRSLACVCRAVSAHAQVAARQAVEQTVSRLKLEQSRVHRDCGSSWIVRLRDWERTAANHRVWLEAEHCTTSGNLQVAHVQDLSGNAMHAAPPDDESVEGPTLRASALNGHAVLDFARDGPGAGLATMLRTPAFATPLTGPLTYFLVARASGDVTMLDSFGPASPSLELCHGYPNTPPHSIPQVAVRTSGHVFRGETRSQTHGSSATGWHVYSASFDGPRSAIYVDGICEGRSTSPVEHLSLDGLSVGIDAKREFPLDGSIAEVRVLAGSLPAAHREHIEAALAGRYGLGLADDDAPPAKQRRLM